MRRYTMLLVLTGLMFGGLIGCEMPDIPLELPSNSGNDAENSGNNSADSAENAPTHDDGNSQPVIVSGTKSTLFKPVSESRGGRAAVIVQCTIRAVSYVAINGVEDVFEYRPGYANGNRVHIFLGKTGKLYPPNSVIIVHGDGKVWRGVWANPAERKSLYLVEVQ